MRSATLGRPAGSSSMRTPITPLMAGDISKPRRSIRAPAPRGDVSGVRFPGARGTAVGTGKQNTADLLASCTDAGTAAVLCSSLRVNGTRGWFLPSRDELALMYRNLKAAGIGDFQDGGAADNFTYWASSQQTADMAVHI